MVACASSADCDFEETLNTLKYAHRARNIKNKPVVNHDPRVAQLAAMQDEIEALRSELRRVSGTTGPAAGEAWAARDAPNDTAPVPPNAGSPTGAEQRQRAALTEQALAAEATCEVLRGSLSDVYGAVCRHLPAIWRASGLGVGEATGTTPAGNTGAKQALTAICEALQAGRRVLGDSMAGAVGDDEAAHFWGLARLGASEKGGGSVEEPGLTETRDAACLSTLSDMRRDSTPLIRKYLEEIKRLEVELVQYRRKTKHLQEELLEARDDLRKDEEIFGEKMREMKALVEHNEVLSAELREAFSHAEMTPDQESQGSVGVEAEGARPDRLRHLGRRLQAEGGSEARSARQAGALRRLAGDGRGSASSSTASRAGRLEQQIDEHIQRYEASQSLEDDLKRYDALLRKREQYLSYRAKIEAKDTLEQHEACEQLRQLDARLSKLDLVAASNASNSTASLRDMAQRQALLSQQADLELAAQSKRAEGLSILRDIDERLEGLQDELDFREARVAEARQLLQPPAHGAATLEGELAAVPAEDAKELLLRYCQRIIRLQQRDAQSCRRVAAVEAQLDEKRCQVSELQQVLRQQDAISTKAIARLTAEYEGRTHALRRQLNVAMQHLPPELRDLASGVAEVG